MKLLKGLFSLILIGCLIGVGAFFYAFFLEPNQVKKETVEISDPEVNGTFRLALFADTHFSKNYTPEDFSKAVKLINESNPDIIVFLGDLFDEFSTYEGDDQKISAALAELKAKKGKFAVFGNHDYGGGAENEYVGVMDAGGFRVLVNQSVQFKESNVTLTGVDDYLIGYGNASVVNENPLGAYNIVACHEPDVIDKIMNSPVDLMISGHTHGGQVKLPFVEPRYLPDLGKKYIQGKFEINNLAKTTLYVNRGLGTTKAPARLFSVPEVTIIDLK